MVFVEKVVRSLGISASSCKIAGKKAPLKLALYYSTFPGEEEERTKTWQQWTLSKMNLCYSFNQFMKQGHDQGFFDIAQCLY